MSMHPTAIEADRDRQVVIVYKNYRDEVKTYVIIPHAIHFGVNAYHKERQWLMNATDVSRNVFRCPHCGGWHLAHKNRSARRAPVSKTGGFRG